MVKQMLAKIDYIKMIGREAPAEYNKPFPFIYCEEGSENVDKFLVEHGFPAFNPVPEHILQKENYMGVRNGEMVYGAKDLLIVCEP